ncbi:MAG: hypothetical protein IJ769_08565 [Clostridia bacterium]|nr:hypothetical protein [Clostridia bacterium]
MNTIAFRLPFEDKLAVMRFGLKHDNLTMSETMRRLVMLLLTDETIQKRICEGEDL